MVVHTGMSDKRMPVMKMSSADPSATRKFSRMYARVPVSNLQIQ